MITPRAAAHDCALPLLVAVILQRAQILIVFVFSFQEMTMDSEDDVRATAPSLEKPQAKTTPRTYVSIM
jgi:hypothetical protein